MHVGRTGACWWILIDGEVTQEGHARVVDTLRSWGTSTTPVSMLFVAHGTNAPTAKERRDLADTVMAFSNPDNLRGFALVTSSSIVRGALTAIGWLVKAPMPYRACGNPSEALEWLRSLQPEVDAALVHAAITAAEPRYPSMRW